MRAMFFSDAVGEPPAALGQHQRLKWLVQQEILLNAKPFAYSGINFIMSPYFGDHIKFEFAVCIFELQEQ